LYFFSVLTWSGVLSGKAMRPNVPLQALGRSAEREGQVACKRLLGGAE
jgi:hypothetical protein